MSSDTQALSRRGAARPAIQPGAILAAVLAEQMGHRRVNLGAVRVHLLVLLLLLATGGLVYAPVSAQTFAPKVNVSNTARADSMWPGIVVVSPHVYVLWADANYLFSRSSDSGQSFSAPVQVIPDFAKPFNARALAATGFNVYVAYSGRPKPKQPTQVFFKRSTNNGASFGAQVQISSGLNIADLQGMAISGANVYVVWRQSVGAAWNVFLARSTDGGATFSSPVNLSNSSATANPYVRMAAEGPGVHVAWSEEVGGGGHQEIFYRGSTDGGASFGPVLNVSNSQTPNSVMPAIAVSGPYVYLAWRESGVRFAMSADGGATFTAPVDLAPGWTDMRGVAAGPAIAASGTAVQVIWHADPFGSYQVFHRASADSGATFGPENNISMAAQDSLYGVVTVNGAHVYVAWPDPSGEVFLVHSADNGATFGAAINVSQSPGGSGGAALATTPTEIYVVWSDAAFKGSDVFFVRGTVP